MPGRLAAAFVLLAYLSATAQIRPGGDVTAVEIPPDGKTAIFASMDGHVRFWDIKSRKQTREVLVHNGGVWGLGLSRDGKRFITADGGRSVRIWDTATLKELKSFTGSEKEV